MRLQPFIMWDLVQHMNLNVSMCIIDMMQFLLLSPYSILYMNLSNILFFSLMALVVGEIFTTIVIMFTGHKFHGIDIIF